MVRQRVSLLGPSSYLITLLAGVFRYFPDVWNSWQQLVGEGQIRHGRYVIHGGDDTPVLESYSGNVKGWCEGEYELEPATDAVAAT
jgi:hypothetical protein